MSTYLLPSFGCYLSEQELNKTLDLGSVTFVQKDFHHMLYNVTAAQTGSMLNALISNPSKKDKNLKPGMDPAAPDNHPLPPHQLHPRLLPPSPLHP